MLKAIVMHSKDNVAICLDKACPGDVIKLSNGHEIDVLDDISPFHKIASKFIPKGEKVYKYGEIIGIALTDIKTGQHVHVHNIGTQRTKKVGDF